MWSVFIAIIIVVSMTVAIVILGVQRSNAPSKQELLVEAGLQGRPRLTIGVRDDIPDIAERSADGTFTGFDIEMALAVARELGFTPDKVDLIPIEIEARDTMQAYTPASGYIRVDLVVASYSITPDRIANGVVFSSPYLETTQAVVTRPEFQGTLEGMPDLAGKTVCTLGTSTAEDPLRRIGIIAKARHRISDCIAGLKDGEYDAVQSDAAILAGFIRDDPTALKIHDITLDPPEKWGINTGRNQAMHQLVELALYHIIVTKGEWTKLYAEYIAPAQQMMGNQQQVATATVPEIRKPEIREW